MNFHDNTEGIRDQSYGIRSDYCYLPFFCRYRRRGGKCCTDPCINNLIVGSVTPSKRNDSVGGETVQKLFRANIRRAVCKTVYLMVELMSWTMKVFSLKSPTEANAIIPCKGLIAVGFCVSGEL
ncbi:hypothetical protein AMECASPLE_012292 [Ameca splendens]|uniref:Uncharacterized protein n=1 Tax=Ameca splendens TaxID=208324 RepID=A0ABV0XE38_9TELE